MRDHITSSTFLALVLLLGSAVSILAAPPKQPKSSQYSSLWLNSPFTIKPVKTPVQQSSPLERDWMLGSIRPSGDKHAVTLINKKDRKDRVRFIPGYSAGDFKLLKVEQDARNPKNSRVQIQKGSQTAWISYDIELAKIRTAAAAPKKPTGRTTQKGRNTTSNATRPPIPGRANTGQTGTTRQSGAVRRVRSVPRNNGNNGR